ncbi:hypothetical protein [Fimbriiglobus ruber]|uniref:Phage protein n=1 Tax=Fimbriiglobus ruber TaxID=1908690 RepID=A0A225DQD7_9BACT|nr:hypothetical protein [Fimbriiglobus ruber]OWK39409.1 hypothetical protein FRUB_05972 [Fimbriiglobus ruber]
MGKALRKKNQDGLLIALACGATVEGAARQCGVHERTVYRRLEEPDFKRELQRVRADMLARAAGMLTAAGLESVRTLLELLKPTGPAAIRLGAARAILEIGLRVREVVDLETRIADLEQKFGLEDK